MIRGMEGPGVSYRWDRKDKEGPSMKKLFFLKRKGFTVLCCALAAVLMFGLVNAPAVVASATQRQLPIYCVQRDQKMISISFDAAWGDVILRQGI